MPPKFFQIGFNKCGTTFIAQLFDMNGIPAAHWLEGALAEDIAYAKLTGGKPLARWSDQITAFTDMESVRFLNMPVIEAFKEYALLDQHYPGAVFLLNTRQVEDWVVSRYLHRGGAYARSYAMSLGVALGDLADIWAEDWADHLDGVRAHFGTRPEFIEIDIDEATPEDYRRALAPWYDLAQVPAMPGKAVRLARQSNLPRVARMLEVPLPGAGIGAARRARLADRLARHAAPARISAQARTDQPPTTDALCLDLARGELLGADGTAMPVTRGTDGKFYLDAQRPGLLRVAAVANDIAEVTDKGIYWLDMRPACLSGSGPEHPTGGPLIAGLRRKGAQDLFLWPAPWLHRIGNEGFPGAPRGPDPVWALRADVALWRGGLSGHAPNSPLTAEAAITALLSRPPESAAFRRAAEALPQTPRWRFLAAHSGATQSGTAAPVTDLALTPDPRLTKSLARASLTAPAPLSPPPAIAPRYAICLGGSEGDADFLTLAHSHAVVLKEEDGWESFITPIFRPWSHYIPLAPGATDLTDRLTWARANPDACQQMSERARRLCEGLADPAGRRLHLAQVLSDYRDATGQA
ncbi:glycosyl transferase family 90 [Paracoccus nototheniae]|uniref:Glycosyl transferase family 90 n=1 Tax=Paracoccus nototheniae TaxID=2489002 RepID=A0ABW4DTJ6_9RHOB|nr:glycosyl transferase family 90 [Paracoccus nototheniae]